MSQQDFYEILEHQPQPQPPVQNKNKPDLKTILKHLGLFILTFATVSFTGMAWVGKSAGIDSMWPMVKDGALFATLLLTFLGTHEFGHYFAAIHHNVRTTLPYFIPIPIGIGTFGAVIRIKEKVNDTYKLFDIGISGPLVGFIVSLILLFIGFFTLPDPSYIMNFAGHDAIQHYVTQHGVYPDHPVTNHEELLTLGNTLLYSFIAQFFNNVPPMWEMYHYPFLFAGWLGLFFTALNLTPIGQLDGGHILYTLIGFRKHRKVARVFFGALTVLCGIGFVPVLKMSLGSYDNAYGTLSWLLWAGVLFFLLRKAYHREHKWIAPVWGGSMLLTAGYLYGLVGNLQSTGSLMWLVWAFFLAYFVQVEHPPAFYERPLDTKRTILGWLSMIIFILCISPNPIYFQ